MLDQVPDCNHDVVVRPAVSGLVIQYHQALVQSRLQKGGNKRENSSNIAFDERRLDPGNVQLTGKVHVRSRAAPAHIDVTVFSKSSWVVPGEKLTCFKEEANLPADTRVSLPRCNNQLWSCLQQGLHIKLCSKDNVAEECQGPHLICFSLPLWNCIYVQDPFEASSHQVDLVEL